MPDDNSHHPSHCKQINAIVRALPRAWQVGISASSAFNWLEFSNCSTEVPSQGWKVHVSVAAHEWTQFSASVLPVLINCGVSFKIPDGEAAIVRLNSGEAGASQIGKVVTLYPSNDSVARKVIAELQSAWPFTQGPIVPSDLKVAGSNSIFVRYGAFRKENVVVDASGHYQMTLLNPGGNREADVRSESGLQPLWVGNPPVPCEVPLQGQPGSLINEEFLPVMRLSARPKGVVYLGIRISNAQAVVIKTALRGVGGDSRGFDARARLKNEYDQLMHLASRHNCHVPEVLHFSETGEIESMLVLSDVGGMALDRKSREQQLEALPSIAIALNSIHDDGIAHRDIKLGNIISTVNGAVIIDFELAAPNGATRIPKGGTLGYIPPEGSDEQASHAADRYAFGAMCAGILLELCPSVVPDIPGKLLAMLKSEGFATGIPVISRLMDTKPEQRPDLITASQELFFAVGGRSKATVSRTPSQSWVHRAAIGAGYSTRRFRQEDRSRAWWSNAHFESDHVCEGINIGAAGIVLGLAIIQSQVKARVFDEDILAGSRFLVEKPFVQSPPGFFLGSAGVALALAIGSCVVGDRLFLEGSRRRLEHSVATVIENDLFFGLAGVLLAATIIHEISPTEWSWRAGQLVSSRLLESAKAENGLIVWPFVAAFERSHRPCLGAAHGTAGIAMALGRWANLSKDASCLDLTIQALASIRKHGTVEHNGGMQIARRSDLRSVANPREWCHGTLGYLWAMLAVRCPDELFDSIDWALAAVRLSPLTSNPTYCHGLSGELEVMRMLSLHNRHQPQVASDRNLILRRLQFLHQRNCGDAIWGSENPRIVTPDLWVGFLGPAASIVLNANNVNDSIFSGEVLRAAAQIDVK